MVVHATRIPNVIVEKMTLVGQLGLEIRVSASFGIFVSASDCYCLGLGIP